MAGAAVTTPATSGIASANTAGADLAATTASAAAAVTTDVSRLAPPALSSAAMRPATWLGAIRVGAAAAARRVMSSATGALEPPPGSRDSASLRAAAAACAGARTSGGAGSLRRSCQRVHYQAGRHARFAPLPPLPIHAFPDPARLNLSLVTGDPTARIVSADLRNLK